MPRTSANGGMVGKTLDFNTTAVYNAIRYVGGATATARDSGSVTVTFTSLTGGIGGVQTGDLVIAAVGAGVNADRTMAMSTTGYTTLFDLYANDSDDINLGVHYKVMGATPDTSASTGDSALGSFSTLVLAVQVWRGVNTSTPIGVFNSTTGFNGGNPDPPAITTGTLGSAVIAVGAAAHSNGNVSATQGGDLENFITAGQNGASTDATVGVGSVISSPSRATGTVVDPIAFVVDSSTNSSRASSTFELIPKTPVVIANSGVWDIGWRYVENS